VVRTPGETADLVGVGTVDRDERAGEVPGLLGAVLVVGADLVTRTVLPDALPVGILTAVLGAPYLLWLLVRGRRRSTL
jgi:ABC-type Fe3+-siderophore transport system permease subunit